ncbi:DUF2065 domain-containing protein [Marinomonas sp. IMCC 4694]|uniref:DUF2065 domain-containing protein n=1 Tax=Marinomonas sp. IMCC 4694 TaxID=2605432 RepID=UPI0011E6A4EE|nr:DUF2065 domain-containing protein [Marinomonas sp. IMCC 4694]TYL47644.1 DUF2065 domain-containing protein [Marinomonas sp. IMCC 4694]
MQELLSSLLVGVSLLLIVEGVLPFLAPRIWRKVMEKAIASPNLNLRILGAVSMFLGLTLLLLTRRYRG